MPMVETNRKIKELSSGETLEIVATDPATETDIPSWCKRSGNELLTQEKRDGTYVYHIRKR